MWQIESPLNILLWETPLLTLGLTVVVLSFALLLSYSWLVGSTTVAFTAKQIRTKVPNNSSKKSSSQTTNAEAIKRKRDFLQRAGEDYGYRRSPAGFIDSWRATELPALVPPVEEQQSSTTTTHQTNEESCREVYLDYAGAALPWRSQLEQIGNQVSILANPHSTGPAAARTARRMEHVQKRLLDWLDAQPGRLAGIQRNRLNSLKGQKDHDDDDDDDLDHHPGYEILFTSGTTQAMQIVAERLAWKAKCQNCGRSSQFVCPVETHTSLIGMRGCALARGASFHCLPIAQLVSELNADKPPSWYKAHSQPCLFCPAQVPNLLAVPLECNFGGNRTAFSQAWVQKLSQPGRPCWSLLDIAKAVSTGPVSLRRENPDFCTLSFYKIFGAPTGLGCLLVKRSILNEWLGHVGSTEQLYYGGGSVDLLLPQQNITIPRSSPSLLSSLNSGTCHFRGIVDLNHGFDIVDRLGMEAIRRHTLSLSRELFRRFRRLRHANNSPVVVFYGAWSNESALEAIDIGPTLAFNLRRQDGSYVGFNEVAKLAALNRPYPIQLRVGCFCNPGACQQALQLKEDIVLENHRKTGHVCGDDIDIIDGMPTGAVRVSFGKDSTWEDLDALVSFVERLFVANGSKLDTSWDNSPRQGIVEEQYIFPIKSCAAQRVHTWTLEASTFKLSYDREFALVDSSGTAMRLQRHPKMAFIEPTISLEQSTMTVQAPGMPPLEISIDDSSDLAYGQGVVKVCGNKCSGILWGDMAVSRWFSEFLNVQCWLARFAEGGYALPPDTPAKKRDRSVAFANEQPLLLISKHAVDLLNDVLESQNEKKVTSRHFRPNFVVHVVGEKQPNLAHAEDGWKHMKLQEQNVRFDVVGYCARCSMVDVDPRSGKKGHTLRALADYRRSNGQINFGIFLKGSLSSDTNTTISVKEGDIFECE
eukprot:scaffold3226_cov160-Amphora_coffeaeformis.AAC.22